MTLSTLLALLHRAALVSPNRGLILPGEGQCRSDDVFTYPQLYYQAQHNALLLRQAGVLLPGKTIIIYFDNHKENILWFWSIVAGGGIPAVLSPLSADSETREAQLDNVHRIFTSPTIITCQQLAESVKSVEGFKILIAEDVTQTTLFKDEIFSPNLYIGGDSLAAILFTSGSTGRAKAVEYTHAQLITSAQVKSAFHTTDSQTNFLSWISFDHSANLCELHLNAMYSASNQIHVPTAELVSEPARFFHLLSLYKIGYTFLPNFFLATATRAFLAQETQPCLDLSQLSVIMTGGEANKTSTILAAETLLIAYQAPPCTIKSAYGLSETCSACFYNTSSPAYDLGNNHAFASVGKHIPEGLELRIVDDNGRRQAPGVPGAIQLRGDVVFKRYHNNPLDTKACLTPDQWFDTGDVGTLDCHGNLNIVGRSKEIFIINGNNYSSFELEHAIETSDIQSITPSYTATFSTREESGDTESVVVLFNPSDDMADLQSLQKTISAISKAVVGFCAKQPLAVIPLPKERMPKSSIGKLSRRNLKESYESGAFNQYRVQASTMYNSSGIFTELQQSNNLTNEQADEGLLSRDSHDTIDQYSSLSSMGKKIADIYSALTKVSTQSLMGPDAFLKLGLDSLDYMRIKTSLDAAFRTHQEIPMSILLRSTSIDELEHSLLNIGTFTIEYDPIVTLAVRGSKPPIFLFHPGSGEFLCWMRFLPSLPDRPVYALRAKGLHKGEETFSSFEELLSCYYDSIKRTQPHGPYALLGFCFGGILAFELAKRLEAAGDETSFICGVDTPPDPQCIMGKHKHRSLMIDVFPEVTSRSREEAEVFARETAHMDDDEFYAVFFAILTPGFGETMDLTPSRLQAYGRVEDSIRHMAGAYYPHGSVSKYDCFRACGKPLEYVNMTKEAWHDKALGQWSEFCRSEVRWYDVKGDHVTCMKDPYVDDLKKQLQRALEARGI